MKFGEVDIGRSGLEGAILAHTLRLGNGAGAIKKGVRLQTGDLERLRQAGYERITVATLEAGDVHEDAAATSLGARFVDPTLESSSVRTGRCNLHATVHGLVAVDRARVDSANQVSEGITIATLDESTLVSPGDMVATIKIIPFSVPETALRRCEEALGECALRVDELNRFDAGLVLTELPGVNAGLLERASRAQRARLDMLGSSVRREIRCAHSVDAVGRAIATLKEEGCDPILLLGASAIVDRGDVIPAALERVGGHVVHLGMPVDPGNLLMVGRFQDTSVFGLPGCARSLSPSGFDHVLRHFFVGNSVDSAWVSSLGVGGLLKETKERPMPRNLGGTRAGTPSVAAIVLAAGSSKRMGDTNKLTVPIEGVPMVARVVDALLASRVRQVLVVTGHEPEAIASALGDREVTFVHNTMHEAGMGTSVAAGFEAVSDEADGALVALGDMPWIDPGVVNRLIESLSPDGDLSIYVPMFGRKRGNPVLFGARHFPELRRLGGDVGGKVLFHRHSEAICYVDVTSAAVNIDIDTPEALEELGIDVRNEPDPP